MFWGRLQRVILTRCQPEVNPKKDLEDWEEKTEGEKERLRGDKNFQEKLYFSCCPGLVPLSGQQKEGRG